MPGYHHIVPSGQRADTVHKICATSRIENEDDEFQPRNWLDKKQVPRKIDMTIILWR
jgi:hypothetical protein